MDKVQNGKFFLINNKIMMTVKYLLNKKYNKHLNNFKIIITNNNSVDNL